MSHKIKDRSMEGKTLWVWSQALWKKGNLDEAISRGQKALKIETLVLKIASNNFLKNNPDA